MPRREETLPRDWQRNKDTPFEAQIVSIHTGTSFSHFIVLYFFWIFIANKLSSNIFSAKNVSSIQYS
jgi:hypothetical protein